LPLTLTTLDIECEEYRVGVPARLEELSDLRLPPGIRKLAIDVMGEPIVDEPFGFDISSLFPNFINLLCLLPCPGPSFLCCRALTMICFLGSGFSFI
jgi:hypothetical protein